MGTLCAQIPQVQKLLLPLQEREREIQDGLRDLEAQVLQRKVQLLDVQREISSLLAWQPPAALVNLYADERIKSKAHVESGVAFSDLEDDEEDEDVFFDCEDDEQEEPAPPQPEDPLSASLANEDEYTFDVLNAAMAVLREEHADCVREGEATGKRKMSLLDRCFFDVREYMGRLVASLPPLESDEGRNRVPAVLPDHLYEQVMYQPHLIAGGSTQMGKTMFIVIGYVAAWFAKCPMVCVTTTVSGTKSLHKKVLSSVMRLEGRHLCKGIAMHCSYSSAVTEAQMSYFCEEIRAAERPVTAKGKKAPVRIHRDVVARAALGGSERAPDRGILFIADTAAQMRRAVKLITEVRAGSVGSGCFGLMLDEADSFQRTEDETLQLEQRLNDLKGTGIGWRNEAFYDTLGYDWYGGPSFQGANVLVSISATLLPVLLKMFKQQQERKASLQRHAHALDQSPPLYTFFTKAPPSKYVGVLSEVWQPFKRHARPVFLRPDEVKGTNLGGILDGHYRDPNVGLHLESSVLALYGDACAMPYSLLLDITVSRVNVEGASLRDKAQWLAGHFTNLTVITVDGLMIRYKLPSQSWGASSWVDGMRRREKTVEDLLNELEPKMQGSPAAIFGYSQMIRGDSFRSDWRVPTHILQQLSNAMSVDRLVQSAGRASFIGRELLDVNAIETAGGKAGHVRVLMTDGDYMTIRAYVEFMNMLAEEIGKGKTVEELFDPRKVSRKYLPHFSILIADTQRRCIGNKNENLQGVLDASLFEDDLEASAAYVASCACDEASKHFAMAEKRLAAASDAEKKLALRQEAAKKCLESATLARNAAQRAQREADASTKEAAVACRRTCVVRPCEKAAMDAAEAMNFADESVLCAANALAEVTHAEVQARVEKIEQALEKAREKKNNAKALERVAEMAEEAARELMALRREILAPTPDEVSKEEEGEGAEKLWVKLEETHRKEIAGWCQINSDRAHQLALEAVADVTASAGTMSVSCRKETGAGGLGKGVKAREREDRKREREANDAIKSVRQNLEAARKLFRKASESFARNASASDHAPDHTTSTKPSARPHATSGKVRVQKLMGNAGRISTMAAEARRLAGEINLRDTREVGEETHERLTIESEDAAAEVEKLATEVAVEAVAGVTEEIHTKIKAVRDLCKLLTSGESSSESNDDAEQEEDEVQGVAAVWMTTAQGRKKVTKISEMLHSLIVNLKAGKSSLVGCSWASVDSCMQHREESSSALALQVKAHSAACTDIDIAVDSAQLLVDEVLELLGPRMQNVCKETERAMEADTLAVSSCVEAEEDEQEVYSQRRMGAKQVRRRRQIVDSDDSD